MTGRLNLLCILAIAIIGVDASNFNKPHSHTGKVEPFKPGDPNVKLDGRARGILKSGKPYQVSGYYALLTFLDHFFVFLLTVGRFVSMNYYHVVIYGYLSAAHLLPTMRIISRGDPLKITDPGHVRR